MRSSTVLSLFSQLVFPAVSCDTKMFNEIGHRSQERVCLRKCLQLFQAAQQWPLLPGGDALKLIVVKCKSGLGPVQWVMDKL
jgi:hypothetical protein